MCVHMNACLYETGHVYTSMSISEGRLCIVIILWSLLLSDNSVYIKTCNLSNQPLEQFMQFRMIDLGG